jgi:DnaJ-class molecular chaperone
MRKKYDQFGTVGNIGDVFTSPFTRTAFQEMMRDFGGAGLRFDFLGDIFDDFLNRRGSSFSFRNGSPRRMRFAAWPGQEINLDEIFGQARRPQEVNYELAISRGEALQGVKKVLRRKGKKLEVKIPARVKGAMW